MRARPVAVLAAVVTEAAAVAVSLPATAGLGAESKSAAPEADDPGQYPVVRTAGGLVRGEASSMVTFVQRHPVRQVGCEGEATAVQCLRDTWPGTLVAHQGIVPGWLQGGH